MENDPMNTTLGVPPLRYKALWQDALPDEPITQTQAKNRTASAGANHAASGWFIATGVLLASFALFVLGAATGFVSMSYLPVVTLLVVLTGLFARIYRGAFFDRSIEA